MLKVSNKTAIKAKLRAEIIEVIGRERINDSLNAI